MLTKKLGYSNQLKELLKAIEANYKNKNTYFDDLIVLFGYCALLPEDFGYEEDELTNSAKALIKKIRR